MTKLKRLVAVALAVLMILGSFSMAASALDVSSFDGNNLTISTKIFREVNGEWVETQKVKQGETVKARVFLGTDYYTSSGNLLFFYDTNFFDDAYGTSKETLVLNPYYSSSPYAATGDFYAPGSASATNIEKYMLNNNRLAGIVSETDDGTAFSAAYDAFSVGYEFGPTVRNQKLNINKWFCEFTLTVKTDASGTGDFLAVENTTSTPAFTSGYINVPKGTYDTYNENVVDMANWDAELIYTSQPVSLYINPVRATFNAGDGAEFADGEATKIYEGEAGEALAVEIPEKDNYEFLGWKVSGSDAATANVTVYPAADTEYVAVWAPLTDVDETLTFRTEIHRLNPETGEYEKTEKVKRGETVKARLYIDTTYFTNTGDIIVFYDNDFFTDAYANDIPIDLTVNTASGTSAADLGVNGTFAKATNTNNEIVKRLTDYGYLTTDFVGDHTAFAIQYRFNENIGGSVLEGETTEDWFVEFDLQVLNTATGWGDFFIVEKTIENPNEGYYAHINVPLSTDGGSATDAIPMYLWEVNTVVTSNPVTVESSITLDANGGTFAENSSDTYVIEGYVGDKVAAPEEPTKEGYTFMGWVDEDGNAAEIPAELPVEDITLTAVWQAEVDITYVLNNGEADIVVTVTSGQPFVAPEEPTKTGSYFDGWTDKADVNIATGLPEVYPDVDTTYYAVYETYDYPIYYYVLNPDDPKFELAATATAEYGAVIPATPAMYAVPEGYSLSDAYTDVSLSTKLADGATMPAESIKLYYKLVANTYDAVFNANGGAWADGATEKKVATEFDTPITAPEDPTLEGYDFIGWEPAVGIMDEEGKSFLATWEPATYMATYKVDGEVYDAFETKYGEEVDIPADPYKEGYTFVEWTPAVDATMPAHDTEYIAVFEENKYDAIFDAADGYWTVVDENGDPVVDENGDPVTTTEDKVVETVYDEAIEVPADPEKEGYVFGGWDPVPGTMPAEDTTYTAIWNPATDTPYTVEIYTMDTTGSYEYEGNPVVQNKTGTTGTIAEVTASAAEGFYVADESVLSAEILPDGSTVLKIYYARNEYTITFYSMGGKFEDGSIEDTKTYYHGAAVTAPVATRTGWTFAGWDTTVVPKALEDAVYNATWTVNQYTITFDTVGGTEIDPITLDYNKAVELPAEPEKEGHVFDGWTWTMTDENGETVVIDEPEKMPAYDVNAEANWTPDTFDATFDANGGEFDGGETTVKVPTVFDTEIAVPGEEGSAYDEPTRDGYEFDGWVDENGNAPEKMDEEGKNFTAVWVPADMTVPVEIYLMDTDGTYSETPDETSSVASKTEATATVVPEAKDNYTVDTEKSVLEAVVEPDGSTVLKIYYALDKTTISFDVDGTVTEVEGLIGADVPADKVPATEKDGYTFEGWEAADGTVSENAPATFPEESETLKAVWTPKQYKVTYISDVIDNGDGTTTNVIVEGFNEKLVDCGADVPAPEMPTKVGYTFGGWFDADGVQNTEYKTMPAKDLVFTAKWNSIDGVPYTFEVYEMKVDGTYPDTATSTTTLTDGEVGKTVTVGYTAPAGFTLADSKLSGKIVAGEDLVLYAYIARNEHKFTAYYDTEKSSIVAQDDYLYGAPIAAVADPVKQGYAFTGWVDESGASVTIPGLMGDEDITVYATWSENAFDATFDAGDGYFVDENGDPIYDDNGDKVSTETNPTTFGEDISAPANDPVKDGYTFVGWAPADDPENVITDGNYGTMDDEDGKDFVAVWTEASYKLTFYEYVAADGGPAAPTVAKSYAETTVKYGDEIVPPPVPEFDGYYTFLGWVENSAVPPVIDSEDAETFGVITNEELATMTMPAGDYNLYAVYERIPVKLVPIEGSTTMVERDGVIESYNDGYTVTPDPYDTPDSYEEWYIYGLRVRLTEKTLLNKYVTVLGDGRIEVERVTTADGNTYGSVGTGAVVKVFDNVTGEQVEQFYIIIYGDINGDADANAGDAAAIYDETINVTSWSIKSSDEYRTYKVKAGNVIKDREINTMDGLIVKDYAVGVCDIDQITCTVIPL